MEELRRIEADVYKTQTIEDLRALFDRVQALRRTFVEDFDVQLRIGQVQQEIIDRGQVLIGDPAPALNVGSAGATFQEAGFYREFRKRDTTPGWSPASADSSCPPATRGRGADGYPHLETFDLRRSVLRSAAFRRVLLPDPDCPKAKSFFPWLEPDLWQTPNNGASNRQPSAQPVQRQRNAGCSCRSVPSPVHRSGSRDCFVRWRSLHRT